MSYSSEVLADSPWAYLHLDETSGTSAADSSGNSKNGTYVNSPTLNQTSLLAVGGGKAVTFASASSQYINTGDGSGFQVYNKTTGFTWELWVKFTGTTQMVLYSEGSQSNSQTGAWLNTNVTTGKLTYFVRGDGAGAAALNVTGTTSINDGNSHHIVVTDTGGSYVVYIDNNVEMSGTYTAPTLTANRGGIAALNRQAGLSNYLNGTVDEVAVYKTVLTGTRVTAHWNAANNITYTDTASGTITSSGSLTEATRRTDTAGGALSLAGLMTETFGRIFTDAPTGQFAWTGTVTDRKLMADAVNGTVTFDGQLADAYLVSRPSINLKLGKPRSGWRVGAPQ